MQRGPFPCELVEVTAADRAAATCLCWKTHHSRRLWGRGRFSKRSASPPDPLSRRVAGNRLIASCELVHPCSVGRSLASWLRSRRLTEPPRPANYCPRRGRRFPKGDRKALWSPPQRRNPPRCIGRGGSVSRRDLNPAARPRAQLAWARKSEARVKPIPSRSSGGSAREGKDSHSRQWRLSMAVFLNRNKRP